ncbi:MAG TPA: carboxypeptidase-like regulatory domain-containing protein, partial [Terriglobales bacterium]|nr:carboxypeptidase-like regulatory domain-containing protein [Terriglobales bacterium]
MASGKTKIALLSFLIMCSGALLAQTSTGTIVGRVTDSSGAVVANARVKLTLTANGTTRDTTTNQTGDFSAPVIPPGEYTIAVSAEGFADKTLTGVTLLVDQTL